MGMCQKHRFDLTGRHRQRSVFKDIEALLHAAVHKEVPAAHLQQCAAAGHLMCCTDKGHFHSENLPIAYAKGSFAF